uniref:Uncharacterized protein n=1 Tax=Musa acuminata subsp. malaccensis TaxID=214687 RepID=A0A804KL94_MUSAM
MNKMILSEDRWPAAAACCWCSGWRRSSGRATR